MTLPPRPIWFRLIIPISASLGDALVQSLVNDQFDARPLPPAPQRIAPETYTPASQPPGMKAYTEAATEFTSHASSFLQHLPLLAKARAAYAEAIRASAEMRQVLDAGDERLRTLMNQMEQAMSAHGVKPPRRQEDSRADKNRQNQTSRRSRRPRHPLAVIR